MSKREWYPLDNAANIYPVIRNRNWTPMFRMTAVLKENADPILLQQALDKCARRFPHFCVRLKTGMFWYYLEHSPIRPVVEEDTHTPCPALQPGELPFRIKYWRNRVSGEFSHMICDGGGAMAFFKALMAEYVRGLGAEVPLECGILDLDAVPDPEEWEDAFARYSRMGATPSRVEPRAYHPTGSRLPAGMRLVTTGRLSVKEVAKQAKSYRASITEYLTATLMYVLYCQQAAERYRYRQPVKISVPINLRKYYPTRTMRNFSQYLNPGIDPNLGDFTFEETLQQVHHYFRYMFTEKNMNARISKNVSDERNWVLRMVPLFLKKMSIKLVYLMTGEKLFSTVISNVGVVDLPKSMQGYFDHFFLTLCTARKNAVECGLLSFQDTMTITFTRSIAEPHVERLFFRTLVQQGLHVMVESNQG